MGFDPKDVEFVLEDFHRVEPVHSMDEAYFDVVFEEDEDSAVKSMEDIDWW